MNLTEHLRSRHLDMDLHRPVLDNDLGVATFYLWNLSGQLVGYQQYNPNGEKKPSNNPKTGKYYTYRKLPTHAVWGVESLHLTPNVVFLTEGLFDAARLTSLGYSALAALSNNPTRDFRNWLSLLNRPVVAVCDNDKAGRQLAKFGDFVEFTSEKDLGDSTHEEVLTLLKKYDHYVH